MSEAVYPYGTLLHTQQQNMCWGNLFIQMLSVSQILLVSEDKNTQVNI